MLSMQGVVTTHLVHLIQIKYTLSKDVLHETLSQFVHVLYYSLPTVLVHLSLQVVSITSLTHANSVDSQDLDLLMTKQLRLCTSLLSGGTRSANFYQKQVDAGLNAWYTFIPRRVRHSYCWHARFNMPNTYVQELLTAWVDLRGIEQRYSTSYASLMLNLVHGRRVIPGLTADNLGDGTRSKFFCLPNIYLAGFPKCGTTSLYSLITSHPLLAKPQTKEGHFWREFVKTVNPLYKQLEVLHYLFHCKAAAEEMETSTAKITIDASASTVFASPNTGVSMEKDMCILPTLLSKVLPDAKYIVIMRNPVERLWSDYWYFCAKARWKVVRNHTKYFNIPNDVALHASEIFHNHTVSVVDDFKTCLLENRSEFECVMRANSEDGKVAACMGARVGVGLYYFHIVKWLSILPRNKFLFLRMEDLIEDTFNVMLKVWTFLEVDSLSKEVLDHHIQNSMKTNANTWIGLEEYRDKFKMSTITHRQLTSFHQPYNKRLAKLLNDDRFLWND